MSKSIDVFSFEKSLISPAVANVHVHYTVISSFVTGNYANAVLEIYMLEIYIDTCVNISHNNDAGFNFELGEMDVPKVTKEYFTNKRKKIVDATMRVCESKPAYAVTLRDVVKECGISTGGIYNYFSSIDEIFVEILNQAYEEHSVNDEFEMVFKRGKSPNEVITDFLLFRGRLIDGIYKQFGRLIFDVQAICINDMERGRKILAGLKGNDEGYNSFTALNNYIDEQIANGSFKCAIPKEHILFLYVTASDGIKKAFVDPDSANELALLGIAKEECATAESMMKILAQAIVKLLGGK